MACSHSRTRAATAAGSARSCSHCNSVVPAAFAASANAASLWREMHNTVAPGRCNNCSAIARPRPRDAPVMRVKLSLEVLMKKNVSLD